MPGAHDDAGLRTIRLLRGLPAQIRAAWADRMLRNGLYIMATTVVTSLFGFVFWVVAAHAFSADEVGRSAALISAMLLVAILTTLGLGQVYISRLAERTAGTDWSLTVSTGLAVAAVASLVGGLVAAGVLPLLVPRLRHGISPVCWLLLPVGVAGAACSMLIDQACLAERSAGPAFWRNTYMSAMRLALMAVALAVTVNGTEWVLVAWTGSLVLFNLIGIWAVLPALHSTFRPTLVGWRQELREIRGLMAGHQSINLSAQAASLVLPVIVAARLNPTANAYFYTTWMLANALFLVAPSIANALFAEGAHAPEKLMSDVRRAARHIVAFGAPVAIGLLLLGRPILTVFGRSYASHGVTLLDVLILAAVFDAGLSLCVAILRVRRGLTAAAAATSLALVVAISATWFLLPPLGLAGAGVGWAAGRAVGMTVGLFFVVRGPKQPAGTATPGIPGLVA